MQTQPDDYEAFRRLSPTTLADFLDRSRVMHSLIRPQWPGMPRIAGPAYPVKCAPGDHLMLHAAIYRAPRGSIVVVEAADADFALAGGNVCAVAQKNGIGAFVLDGAIRDVAEVRALGFPVFARGVIPIAAAKERIGTLNEAVSCGGVLVAPQDVVVADEEGIVVVPAARRCEVLEAAQRRAAAEAALTLEAWEDNHRRRIFEILARKGFSV